MKDDGHKGEAEGGGVSKNSRRDPRQDRLKLALRENLKRRKSQARGRSDVTIAPSKGDEVSLDAERGKEPGE